MNDDPDFDGGGGSRSLDRPNPVEEPTMEYVYAAMILHEADRDVTEENLTDVLDAAGVEVEEPRVKALVAALEDVDIDEAIETAAVPTAGAAPADTADEEEEAPEEEPEEEEEDEDEEEVSGQGLGDLFG